MKKSTEFKGKGEVIQNGKTIATSIIINASPDKVWNVLMNFSEYPKWNPFITSITGEPKEGNIIAATICPPNQKPMLFKPTVLQNKNNSEFRWIGTMGIPYLFDGEHVFHLHDNNDKTTTFHQIEYFRGVLVPFLRKILEQHTLSGFETMNLALKQQVERYMLAENREQ